MIQISEWGWIWKRWFNTKFTPQIVVLHIRVKRWLKWTYILGSNDWYNTFGVIFRFKPRYLVQTWTWTLWYNQAQVCHTTVSFCLIPHDEHHVCHTSVSHISHSPWSMLGPFYLCKPQVSFPLINVRSLYLCNPQDIFQLINVRTIFLWWISGPISIDEH